MPSRLIKAYWHAKAAARVPAILKTRNDGGRKVEIPKGDDIGTGARAANDGQEPSEDEPERSGMPTDPEFEGPEVTTGSGSGPEI